MLYSERPNPRTAQHGDMTTGTKAGGKVTGDRADISPLPADHGKSRGIGRKFGELDALNMDLSGFKLHHFARAS